MLRKEADVLIFVPNDTIYLHHKMKFLDVLKQSDEALFYALDLAQNYFTLVDPNAPDYKELKFDDLNNRQAFEEIKVYIRKIGSWGDQSKILITEGL